MLRRVVLPEPVPPETRMLNLSAHARPQEGHQLGARRVEPVDDVGRSPLLLGELSDGQARAFERDRRDDDVDTGAVFQAGVTDRRGFVDAAADQADDAVDDLAHLPLRLKGHRRQGRLAALLDVDLLWVVGHDFSDVGVGEQCLQRTEPENVVEDRIDKALLVVLGHRHRGRAEVLLGELHDLFANANLVAGVDLVREPLDQLGVDLDLRRGEGRRRLADLGEAAAAAT